MAAAEVQRAAQLGGIVAHALDELLARVRPDERLAPAARRSQIAICSAVVTSYVMRIPASATVTPPPGDRATMRRYPPAGVQ